MTTVRAKHPPYETGRLGDVVNEMRVQGAPTIRCMRFQGELYATEGSHRLFAAQYLGEVPKLVVEIEETDALPDEHWSKVAPTLPAIEFDEGGLLVLDLKDFK